MQPDAVKAERTLCEPTTRFVPFLPGSPEHPGGPEAGSVRPGGCAEGHRPAGPEGRALTSTLRWRLEQSRGLLPGEGLRRAPIYGTGSSRPVQVCGSPPSGAASVVGAVRTTTHHPPARENLVPQGEAAGAQGGEVPSEGRQGAQQAPTVPQASC